MCGSTIDHKKPTSNSVKPGLYNNGYLTWNDGHKNYTASFKVGYKIGSWIPFEYCGFKGVDKTSSNRQIRWRWGLTYTF
ncbi:oligogalacturonate-specific porin KdgM family protein [Escherichia coli]|nr:oligogalacturonate-specific porin KdgM family protein [Escherichia coli]MDM4928884.1 oligogalacturonate-specific porin KdgM family protein [Escherichia coli]